MFARVVGGLRPPPPSNEPASGPSAPPWPWQGGPSFFFFFSPVALASAITKKIFLKIARLVRENYHNKIRVTDNFETKLNKIILKVFKKNFSLVLYGKKIDTNSLI